MTTPSHARRGHIRSALALAGAIVLLAGCDGVGTGTDPSPPAGEPSSSSASTVPTPEQLAGALVTTDDYAGTWTVNIPPDQRGARRTAW
ncbi:hypothetical protein [Nocardioides pinisoli]|uniref:Uncharacterized protein n=1 Tax=Nocardioides pinisoli TaxID=2950279 RepID=A0ABT1KS74_9ACTN|nr:hypothetical protein [Nocardioides pinisoli]MCP3420234.1 hypothetical protein [Nocardioides pinisoli]